jgi:putative oxidoreductase
MLLPHAWPKFVTFGAGGVAASLARRGIEPSLTFAYVIMFVELVGGICVAIGLLTRPFAALCLIEMIVIAFKAHMPNGWSFTVQGGGAEFPVMWAILFLVILIRGGGPYSVDRALGKEV